ncbi:MAG: hypothetical protein KDA42_01740 [Planctomycetales bacterium]|nr:hypothetical protein [Planctomycetales bacterium]
MVPGFERFHSAADADPAANGRVLLTELNCTSCHAPADAQHAALEAKQAPILNEVAQRVRPGYLRKFLADPQATKPGATMPDMFAGLPAAEKEERIEAIVQFLAASGTVAEEMFDRGRAQKGEKKFHEIGCIACHNPRLEGAAELPNSVPLVGIEKKYSIPSLAKFLGDPLAVRPSGRMPQLPLSGDDARNLAHFLGAGANVQMLKNARYRYYEGDWSQLPDFDKLKPVKEGECTAMDLSVSPNDDQFGVVYESFFIAPKQGRYQFWLHSDDGSRLVIDGERVVDNDDIHGPATKDGAIELAAGPHEVRIEFFEAAGGVELRGEFQGPGIARQSLVGALSLTREPIERPDPSGDAPFRPNPKLFDVGRKLFVSSGCAQCHVHQGVKESAGDGDAKLRPLAELAQGSLTAGCLGEKQRPGVPAFDLNQAQRASLVAAIKQAAKADLVLAAGDQVVQTMTTLNCYACHERDNRGGVPQERNELFTGTQKEMGDEGRIPPRLTGVGAKLTHAWLEKIPADGADDRPYMNVAMPKFGKQNTGHLAGLWEQLDTLPAVEPVEFDVATRQVKAAGRLLVGDKAFGCIKCHQFAGHKSTGVQSLEMTAMHQRLRRDWFHQYLLNPQAFRPGTRMPAAWPEGKSPLKKVLDGQAATQIESIWDYLADGGKAALPEGLIGGAIELVPEERPIIYRNFIEGLSPRGIAVGYPKQVNLAFDADRFHLALVWSGKFIDASRHWQGRGQGPQRPLGELPVHLAQGAPLAQLESLEANWPAEAAKEQGYRFLGYRLTSAGLPIFRYRWRDLEIEDFPQPQVDGASHRIDRLLTISAGDAPPANVYFRAAAAKKVEKLAERQYRIDDDWRLAIESKQEPIIARGGELLVPLVFEGGKATITQRIEW